MSGVFNHLCGVWKECGRSAKAPAFAGKAKAGAFALQKRELLHSLSVYLYFVLQNTFAVLQIVLRHNLFHFKPNGAPIIFPC